MLEASNLCKGYGPGAEILRDVSLRLGDEDTLAVVGPSGCGKTSLLYLLCGLMSPDAGEVRLDGRPVQGGRSEIAIILQDYGLLPWRNVRDNVALGLKIQGIARREREQRAGRILAELGLGGRETAFPGQLSGGEQQRVAIARALVQEPRLLLMDEPFSSLDALTRERLQLTLLETWQSRRVPYLIVTHSVEEAVFLGQRVLLLAGRPATIATAFDNPGFGHPDYRDRTEFFSMLRTIRLEMEKHQKST